MPAPLLWAAAALCPLPAASGDTGGSSCAAFGPSTGATALRAALALRQPLTLQNAAKQHPSGM